MKNLKLKKENNFPIMRFSNNKTISIPVLCSEKQRDITIEDIPEYVIPSVIQAPIKTEEKRNIYFEDLLKSTMRLKPEYIYIK